jgi:hypothetical protein
MSLFQLPFRDHDGRETLRSLADALGVLRQHGSSFDSCDIQIKTRKLRLPDRRVTGLVLILGPILADGTKWVIRMPSSASFRATTTLGARQNYDIDLLDGAVSDEDGNVHLNDGRYVHNIDFLPTFMKYDFTDIQRAIVWQTVKHLGVENICCPLYDDRSFPGWGWLHYGMLPNIRLRNMKLLRLKLTRAFPEITDNFIDDTLARAGFQSPRADG